MPQCSSLMNLPYWLAWFNFSLFVLVVLSDQRKRTLYDAGLYDPEDEEDEVVFFFFFPFFRKFGISFNVISRSVVW